MKRVISDVCYCSNAGHVDGNDNGDDVQGLAFGHLLVLFVETVQSIFRSASIVDTQDAAEFRSMFQCKQCTERIGKATRDVSGRHCLLHLDSGPVPCKHPGGEVVSSAVLL